MLKLQFLFQRERCPDLSGWVKRLVSREQAKASPTWWQDDLLQGSFVSLLKAF